MDNTLRTTITADTTDFLAAINAATRSVGNATDNWANRIAAAQNSFTTASVAAAELKGRIDEAAAAGQIDRADSGLADQMTLAADAAQAAVAQLSNAIGEIANGASDLGTTVEEFQEIQAAATDAGISMDDVSSAFETINNVMVEASNANSTASETFDDLGVSLQSLQSLSPSERMRVLQAALDNVQDSTRRSTYANTVFGRSFAQVEVLTRNYGAAVQRAHQRGAIATQQQINELRNLQRQAQVSFQTVTKSAVTAASSSKSAWERFKDAFQAGNLVTVQVLQKAWQGAVKIINQATTQAIKRRREEIEENEHTLQSIRDVANSHQKTAQEAEGLASKLLELATSTDNANSTFVEQASILEKLSHGYGALTKDIDVTTASTAQLARLQDRILAQDRKRSLDDVNSQLKQIEVLKEQQRAVIGTAEPKGLGGALWGGVKDYFLNVGDILGISYAKDIQQERKDATTKIQQLNDQYTELMAQKRRLEKEDPAAEARNRRKASQADAADRLAEEMNRLQRMGSLAGEYEQKMHEIRRDADRYAKQLGVDGQVSPTIIKYIKLRKDMLDAEMRQKRDQQERPRLQASAELDTILHQSTLDKYAKMREDADRKVAEMAKRMGVAEDDDRIQQYRSILEQEISAQEQAEQEKADAAKKAEQEKLEAARRAEQEKAAAARRAEIDRKLSKFGFSEETADRMGLTPAERLRAYRQERKNARIDERINRKASTGRALSPMEKKRLDEFNRLRAEKQANSPEALMQKAVNDELVAADSQRKAADLQNSAAEEMKKAADTLAKKSPAAPVNADIPSIPDLPASGALGAIDYTSTLSAILDRLTTLTKDCYTVRG